MERAGMRERITYFSHHKSGSPTRAPGFRAFKTSSQRLTTLAVTERSFSAAYAFELSSSGFESAQTSVCVSVRTFTCPQSTHRTQHHSWPATSRRRPRRVVLCLQFRTEIPSYARAPVQRRVRHGAQSPPSHLPPRVREGEIAET